MSEKDLKFVETKKGRIYYFLDAREPARPTVVFLHGLSANHTTWAAAFEKFRELKLNCLAPDLRGHGLSDKTKKRPLYRLPVFADDIDAILKKEGLENVILVGYSFGGYIALQYALSHSQSVAALILVSANHVSPLNYAGLGFLNSIVYALINGLAWLLFWQKRRNYYYFDQATASGYWQTTFRGLITMPLTINFWMLSEAFKLNFSRALGNIKCPTLILRGHHDAFLSQREALDMSAMLKDSRLVVPENSSHYLASDHYKKTTEAIINFLKEICLIFLVFLIMGYKSTSPTFNSFAGIHSGI